MMYYAYKSRDGHVYCVKTMFCAEMMLDDVLLFDTAEDCVNYWRENGVEVDRYV